VDVQVNIYKNITFESRPKVTTDESKLALEKTIHKPLGLILDLREANIDID